MPRSSRGAGNLLAHPMSKLREMTNNAKPLAIIRVTEALIEHEGNLPHDWWRQKNTTLRLFKNPSRERSTDPLQR